ncbi:DUF916 domain-containing protein [Actinophytocola sp.]|uniref:DUF916 domain-containing protein n=1 Tax=Actinophytocola sp. TaxID=1872138 RepID=UPI002ED5E842
MRFSPPRLASAALVAALALLSSAPVTAAQPEGTPEEQITFGIRPATQDAPDNRARFTYGATPGAVVRDYVAVSNVSLAPLTLQVYASDAFNTSEGGLDLLPAGRPSTDVGAWTKPETTTVVVGARSVVIVPFTLTVPADATPGDHTGGIVASLVTEQTGANGSKVRVDQRVGARVYLRVAGELRPGLAVEGMAGDYRTNWNPLGRGSATVTYTVRNTGNVRLRGKQKVVVRTPWGSTVDAEVHADLPELLPGNAIQLTAAVPAVLPAGWLTAQVDLDPSVGPDDQKLEVPDVSVTSTFAAVPWAALALLLALVAFVLLWRYRRRGRSAPKPVRTSTSGAEKVPDVAVR